MLEAGSFLADRYEIIEGIGAGGMSDVYKAKDNVLGRFVAIKVLRQEFTEDMNFVTKFHAEAQAAAGLEHPNIVNIYDVGSDNSMHYIVMEYIDGITLKSYIEKKGQLTDKEAISIAIQVGRGIEAAHNKNIIHRDIKPQNIMISKQGKVKVTDFGIAKAVNANTIHSDVMGSVHYSSPEQARNGFVDVKSDIYSLGIVMYEMVTGRVPFDGDTTVAIAIQHIQEEIESPRTYAPDLPVSLEKIILKTTQKSPDRRYMSMADLLVDLKRALQEPDVDFVSIPEVGTEKTRVIRPDELKQIKAQTRDVTLTPEEAAASGASKTEKLEKGEKAETGKSADTSPAKSENKKKSSGPLPEVDDDDDDDDDDDTTGFLNPKMEKVVSILGIVAAVIILLIILYLVISMAGGIKSGSSGQKQDEQTTGQDADQDVTDGGDTTAVSDDAADTEEKDTDEGNNEDDPETVEDTEDTVQMINLLGMTYDTALEKLNDLGLAIYEESRQSSDQYLEGCVIHQSVNAGDQIAKGTTIYVITSSGKGDVGVPDVTGYTDTAAIAMLADAGFGYTREYAYSSDVPEGTVISQTPEAGSNANAGDAITIVVSQGVETVNVPDLKGKTESEAKKALEALGLTIGTVTETYSDEVAVGQIVSQDVVAGKTVYSGTAVNITVSAGAATALYKFSARITWPNSDDVVMGSIYLYDTSDNLLGAWEGLEEADFPKTISVENITSSEGYVVCEWESEDDDGNFSYQTQKSETQSFKRSN